MRLTSAERRRRNRWTYQQKQAALEVDTPQWFYARERAYEDRDANRYETERWEREHGTPRYLTLAELASRST